MKNKKIFIELNENKIKKLLKIKDVIKIVEEGFKKKALGLVELPPKIGPKFNEGAFADAMSVAIFKDKSKKKLDTYGIKWLSGFPGNIKRKLPYLNSVVILNDEKTGQIKAIFDGRYITAIRTACVSAVTTKYLAPKKNNLTIGIIGLGLQAHLHIQSFKCIFKNITFYLYEHNEKSLKNFLAKHKNEKFLTSKNVHEVVKNSDIILTATPFTKKISPLIFPQDLKENVLILPLEYGCRIHPEVFKYLDEIYTDDIEQYNLKKKNLSLFPLNSPKISNEIGSVILKRYKRKNNKKRILAFNLGIALFDVLTAEEIMYQKA